MDIMSLTCLWHLRIYAIVKIRITKHGGADIRVTCSDQRMQGSNNIAYKAAAAILQYTGRRISGTDININIEKNIPVGAGLGGGSADAAAVIVGLNKLLDLKLSKGQLIEIGHGIGSDVPFCIEAVLNENNESSCDSGSSVADKGFVVRVGRFQFPKQGRSSFNRLTSL